MNTILYLGEAMDVMSRMKDGCVDAAVFDPPYKTIGGGTPDDSRRPKGVLAGNDKNLGLLHNDITPETYLPEVHRLLRADAHMYLMTNFLTLKNGLMPKVMAAGFEIHNLLIWRKNNATPNRWRMKDVEYTLLCRKGKAFKLNNNGKRTTETVEEHPLDTFDFPLDHDNPKSPKSHPTEKPVNLMKSYIEDSTEPGDTVLDLFMGSGATGVAAQELGRSFIGIEMDSTYYRTAQIRMGMDEVLDDLI